MCVGLPMEGKLVFPLSLLWTRSAASAVTVSPHSTVPAAQGWRDYILSILQMGKLALRTIFFPWPVLRMAGDKIRTYSQVCPVPLLGK